MKIEEGMDTFLHVCNVDECKLDNGMSSIVTVQSKTEGEEKKAKVDDRGFIVTIARGEALQKKYWDMK